MLATLKFSSAPWEVKVLLWIPELKKIDDCILVLTVASWLGGGAISMDMSNGKKGATLVVFFSGYVGDEILPS